MDDVNYLNDHYTAIDEDARLLSRHGQVEYLTTMRYIHRYLRPGARILEIGAASGRYSHALAQAGYVVDAVELLEHNIKKFRAATKEGEQVTITQGNAIDLAGFASDAYDITLLLGPMYHLFTEAEQRAALSEAVRVTKPGGVIFAAYCMADAAVLRYGFVKGAIQDIMEKCMVDPVTFKAFSKPWDIFQLYRKEDIERLRTGLPVRPIAYLAQDGYANHMRERLAEMSEAEFALFLDYHFATCERPDMTGISDHVLDILCKEQ